MQILSYSIPIHLICTYSPPADRPETEKDKHNDNLQKIFNRYKSKGPTYMMGDFNARIHCSNGKVEKDCVGPYTFDTEHVNPVGRHENSVYNRQLLIDFCLVNEMKISNTFFKKTSG